MDLLIALGADLVVAVALFLSWRAARIIVAPAPSAKRHGWRRAIAYVVLGAIALIPLALLNGRLLLAPLQTAGDHAHRGVPDARLEFVQPCPASAQNVLTLTIHGADVVQDTVELDAALCVGDQTLQHLEFSATGIRSFAQGITQHASQRVQRAAFIVVYEGSLPELTWTRQVSIGEIVKQRLAFFSPGRDPIHVGTLALPLLGNAGDYPLDIYSATGTWAVAVPDGMDVVFGGAHMFDLPITTRIETIPGAADLNWRSNDVSSAPFLVNLILEASRSPSNKLFISVLVLLPLLLFLGVLWTLMPRAAHEGRADARLPAELLVGVGAFLLAVLPIRVVLVPSDVSRLTVVDYALGTEMAVMVAATLMLALAVSEASVVGEALPPPAPNTTSR
jgi:hypothetical protein